MGTILSREAHLQLLLAQRVLALWRSAASALWRCASSRNGVPSPSARTPLALKTPMNEAIGWLSSFILVLTISAQLRKQWCSRTSQGVSKWLFIGQIAASLGFVYYSIESHNWVFVVTNALLGLEALFGLGLVIVQRRAARHKGRASVSERAGVVPPVTGRTPA